MAVVILVAAFALQFAVMLYLRRAFLRRRGPRKPPPDDPLGWPEFERQFAEHVASLGAPESASSEPDEDRPSGQ
jgi:hypothetical protein